MLWTWWLKKQDDRATDRALPGVRRVKFMAWVIRIDIQVKKSRIRYRH